MENTTMPLQPSGSATRPRLHRRDHRGPDRVPRLARRQLGRAVLPPEGLHAGLHHRARLRSAKLKPEFDKRNVKVIGLSRRPARLARGLGERHRGDQGTALNFPLIADADRKVADLYDMIHPNANDTLTVRSVFVIGPDKKMRLMLTYPASTGRNFDEILRVIDSLQLTAEVQGGDAGRLEATARTSSSSRPSPTRTPRRSSRRAGTTVKPYLRITPQPASKI